MCLSAFSWRDALVSLQLRDVDPRAALRTATIASGFLDQTSEAFLRREELLLQVSSSGFLDERSSARLDAASPLYGLWLVRVLRAERAGVRH